MRTQESDVLKLSDEVLAYEYNDMLIECEIYITFRKYHKAEQIINSILKNNPTDRIALLLKERVDQDKIDPKKNRNFLFWCLIPGCLIFFSMHYLGFSGWPLYWLSIIFIFMGIYPLPNFIRYRFIPYWISKSTQP